MYKIYEEYFCSQDIDQRLVAVVVTIRYSEILNCVVHYAHIHIHVHVQYIIMILCHLKDIHVHVHRQCSVPSAVETAS